MDEKSGFGKFWATAVGLFFSSVGAYACGGFAWIFGFIFFPWFAGTFAFIVGMATGVAFLRDYVADHAPTLVKWLSLGGLTAAAYVTISYFAARWRSRIQRLSLVAKGGVISLFRLSRKGVAARPDRVDMLQIAYDQMEGPDGNYLQGLIEPNGDGPRGCYIDDPIFDPDYRSSLCDVVYNFCLTKDDVTYAKLPIRFTINTLDPVTTITAAVNQDLPAAIDQMRYAGMPYLSDDDYKSDSISQVDSADLLDALEDEGTGDQDHKEAPQHVDQQQINAEIDSLRQEEDYNTAVRMMNQEMKKRRAQGPDTDLVVTNDMREAIRRIIYHRTLLHFAPQHVTVRSQREMREAEQLLSMKQLGLGRWTRPAIVLACAAVSYLVLFINFACFRLINRFLIGTKYTTKLLNWCEKLKIPIRSVDRGHEGISNLEKFLYTDNAWSTFIGAPGHFLLAANTFHKFFVGLFVPAGASLVALLHMEGISLFGAIGAMFAYLFQRKSAFMQHAPEWLHHLAANEEQMQNDEKKDRNAQQLRERVAALEEELKKVSDDSVRTQTIATRAETIAAAKPTIVTAATFRSAAQPSVFPKSPPPLPPRPHWPPGKAPYESFRACAARLAETSHLAKPRVPPIDVSLCTVSENEQSDSSPDTPTARKPDTPLGARPQLLPESVELGRGVQAKRRMMSNKITSALAGVQGMTQQQLEDEDEELKEQEDNHDDGRAQRLIHAKRAFRQMVTKDAWREYGAQLAHKYKGLMRESGTPLDVYGKLCIVLDQNARITRDIIDLFHIEKDERDGEEWLVSDLPQSKGKAITNYGSMMTEVANAVNDVIYKRLPHGMQDLTYEYLDVRLNLWDTKSNAPFKSGSSWLSFAAEVNKNMTELGFNLGVFALEGEDNTLFAQIHRDEWNPLAADPSQHSKVVRMYDDKGNLVKHGVRIAGDKVLSVAHSPALTLGGKNEEKRLIQGRNFDVAADTAVYTAAINGVSVVKVSTQLPIEGEVFTGYTTNAHGTDLVYTVRVLRAMAHNKYLCQACGHCPVSGDSGSPLFRGAELVAVLSAGDLRSNGLVQIASAYPFWYVAYEGKKIAIDHNALGNTGLTILGKFQNKLLNGYASDALVGKFCASKHFGATDPRPPRPKSSAVEPIIGALSEYGMSEAVRAKCIEAFGQFECTVEDEEKAISYLQYWDWPEDKKGERMGCRPGSDLKNSFVRMELKYLPIIRHELRMYDAAVCLQRLTPDSASGRGWERFGPTKMDIIRRTDAHALVNNIFNGIIERYRILKSKSLQDSTDIKAVGAALSDATNPWARHMPVFGIQQKIEVVKKGKLPRLFCPASFERHLIEFAFYQPVYDLLTEKLDSTDHTYGWHIGFDKYHRGWHDECIQFNKFKHQFTFDCSKFGPSQTASIQHEQTDFIKRLYKKRRHQSLFEAERVEAFASYLHFLIANQLVALPNGDLLIMAGRGADGRNNTGGGNTTILIAMINEYWVDTYNVCIFDDPITRFRQTGDDLWLGTDKTFDPDAFIAFCKQFGTTVNNTTFEYCGHRTSEFASADIKYFVPVPVDPLQRIARYLLTNKNSGFRNHEMAYGVACSHLVDAFWDPTCREFFEGVLDSLEQNHMSLLGDVIRQRPSPDSIAKTWMGPFTDTVVIQALRHFKQLSRESKSSKMVKGKKITKKIAKAVRKVERKEHKRQPRNHAPKKQYRPKRGSTAPASNRPLSAIVVPRSTFTSRGNHDGMSIMGCEVLSEVRVSNDPQTQSWQLNPVQAHFPKLSGLCMQFTRFRFTSVSVTYYPGCPATRTGLIGVGYSPIGGEAVPLTSGEFAAGAYRVVGTVSEKFTAPPFKAQTSEWFYISDNTNNTDQLKTYQGEVQMQLNEGSSADNETLAGWIALHYHLELKDPRPTPMRCFAVSQDQPTNIYSVNGASGFDVAQKFLPLHPPAPVLDQDVPAGVSVQGQLVGPWEMQSLNDTFDVEWLADNFPDYDRNQKVVQNLPGGLKSVRVYWHLDSSYTTADGFDEKSAFEFVPGPKVTERKKMPADAPITYYNEKYLRFPCSDWIPMPDAIMRKFAKGDFSDIHELPAAAGDYKMDILGLDPITKTVTTLFNQTYSPGTGASAQECSFNMDNPYDMAIMPRAYPTTTTESRNVLQTILNYLPLLEI